MGGEHGEDDKEEGSEGRTKQKKGYTQEDQLKEKVIMGKTTRKKVWKEGQKRKRKHVGEVAKWEGSMGKTKTKKVQKEGQNRKKEDSQEKELNGKGAWGRRQGRRV